MSANFSFVENPKNLSEVTEEHVKSALQNYQAASSDLPLESNFSLKNLAILIINSSSGTDKHLLRVFEFFKNNLTEYDELLNLIANQFNANKVNWSIALRMGCLAKLLELRHNHLSTDFYKKHLYIFIDQLNNILKKSISTNKKLSSKTLKKLESLLTDYLKKILSPDIYLPAFKTELSLIELWLKTEERKNILMWQHIATFINNGVLEIASSLQKYPNLSQAIQEVFILPIKNLSSYSEKTNDSYENLWSSWHKRANAICLNYRTQILDLSQQLVKFSSVDHSTINPPLEITSVRNSRIEKVKEGWKRTSLRFSSFFHEKTLTRQSRAFTSEDLFYQSTQSERIAPKSPKNKEEITIPLKDERGSFEQLKDLSKNLESMDVNVTNTKRITEFILRNIEACIEKSDDSTLTDIIQLYLNAQQHFSSYWKETVKSFITIKLDKFLNDYNNKILSMSDGTQDEEKLSSEDKKNLLIIYLLEPELISQAIEATLKNILELKGCGARPVRIFMNNYYNPVVDTIKIIYANDVSLQQNYLENLEQKLKIEPTKENKASPYNTYPMASVQPELTEEDLRNNYNA